jgi:hypothetical protein
MTLKQWTLCGLITLATMLMSVTIARAADSQFDAETLLFNSPVATDISSFTVDPLEPNTDFAAPAPGCAAMARTSWRVVEGTDTEITVTTAGSSTDTVLAVHTFDSGGNLVQVACNDDSGAGITSSVTFPSAAGAAYYVQTGVFCNDAPSCGVDAATGTIVVTASNADAPANDLRANPESFALNSETSVSNAMATIEPGETIECLNQGPDHVTAPFGKTLWYRLRLPRRGLLRIRSGAAGANSVITLYGPSGAPIACNDDASPTNRQSVLSLDLNQGDYLLQLGGYNGSLPGFGLAADFPLAIDFTPNFDLDGDGSLSPAGGGGDCNDDNAAIRPGAADPPSDGIDQNCDGRDPKDGDRDGVLAPPDGGDCDDANAAIRPGALEIAANAVDENCDGVAGLGRVTSTIQFGFDRVGCKGSRCRGVKLTRYAVLAIPAGATVALRCTGKGCPFKLKSSLLNKATAKLSRVALFKKRTLRKGVVLVLTVTAPHQVGTVKRQIVGKRNLSTPKTSCLPPGTTKPQACTT